MKALLAVSTLIILVSAPCGSANAALAQDNAHVATLGSDEASRYEVEAAIFERKADRYAMAEKQYRAAGKPITTTEARRCADLSKLYRQRAARDRDLARRLR